MFHARKTPRFLIPSVIGIVCAGRGAGGTFLTLAIASYLSECKGRKTAVVELGKRPALHRMTTRELVAGMESPGFCHQGIDCFPNVPSDRISGFSGASYDRIVVDVQEPEDFLKNRKYFDRIIFLGGTDPWNYEDYERLMHSLLQNQFDYSAGSFCGKNLSTEMCRRFREEFGQRLLPCPGLADPFTMDDAAERGLSALLRE